VSSKVSLRRWPLVLLLTTVCFLSLSGDLIRVYQTSTSGIRYRMEHLMSTNHITYTSQFWNLWSLLQGFQKHRICASQEKTNSDYARLGTKTCRTCELQEGGSLTSRSLPRTTENDGLDPQLSLALLDPYLRVRPMLRGVLGYAVRNCICTWMNKTLKSADC
jgi:hypothetical protein